MKTKSLLSRCRTSPRAAVTLVEVLASLALLGTLLAGLLVSFRQQSALIRRSDQRLEAGHLADELLANWACGIQQVPVPAYGELSGTTRNYPWRTQELPGAGDRTWGLRVIRLEVLPPAAVSAQNPLPLITVDLATVDPAALTRMEHTP